MKTLVISLLLCLLVAGCGEEFAAGVGTGMAAMAKMSEDAQIRFIETVNALDAETARLNAEIGAVKDIDVSAFVKPEAVAAIDSLKEKANDPTLWIALASILLGGTGVNLYKNSKGKVGGKK